MLVASLNKTFKIRPGEARTAWLMFAYSFLAMTSYNIVKPLTKGKFIDQLGADNMPYFTAAGSVLIGVLMYLYSRASSRLPGRAVVPTTLGGIGALLVVFWALFETGAVWVSAAFNIFGVTFGILVISQFWTIANDIYETRDARRLFGFIGGGASLGGALGGAITGFFQDEIGEINLLLVAAAVLAACSAIVTSILKQQHVGADVVAAVDERGVGGGEAIRMMRESRHLQIIAAVIGCAAFGAVIVEQQLYQVAEVAADTTVSAFLGRVTVYLSLASFVIQVGLTNVIHRSLGLAIALLILPLGLGTTALVILATGAYWAPAAGRILDTSLRYSLDKTTREVLFLPLPAALKLRAKPFVDVTVDRLAKGVGGLLLLVLIKPWGLGLRWQQLSYASLAVMILWISLTMIARREYLRSFRRGLGARDIAPEGIRVSVADAATIEALVEELAHPEEASVLYAIDMLEMLDRRHLITPLLLHHQSPAVRARALLAMSHVRADLAQRWIPGVLQMLKDPDANVRAAAIRALETVAGEEAPAQLRRFLEDDDPRVAATAATVLADSPNPADPPVAFDALTALTADNRAAAAPARREAAAALAHITNADFREILLPLLHDADVEVAREAIRSARAVGAGDARFVPALVSLLGHRVLKAPARAALIGFGDGIVDALAYFLRDQHEHVWVRRHVPATLAALPSQAALDALVSALDDPDGFLRFKIIEAIETIRRQHPSLQLRASVVEHLVQKESSRYYNYLTLRFNIVQADTREAQPLVVRALDDKLVRTLDRIYRLLGLIYPWQDIAAARHSLERGDARTRSRAIEYLDNLLAGPVRRRVMPIIDDVPLAERVRSANDVLRSRARDLDDTLAQLVHEPDPVVAASAIAFARKHDLWSVTDDLNFLLARPATDRTVRDAAAWALASKNGSGDSGDAADGPLPIVELADRLRAIPLFDFVSVDELFRVAAAGVQVRFETGHVVYDVDAMADRVHFLTSGRVELSGDGAITHVAAPAALAIEDLLAGRPVTQTMTTMDAGVSLSVRGTALLTMMADNIELARGFFRMFVREQTSLRAAVHLPMGGLQTAVRRTPLEPVEKAGLLRRTSILSRAPVEPLLDLIALARDVTLTPGTEAFRAGDAPVVFYLLDGEIRLESIGEEPLAVGPGGLIGMSATLAGLPMGCGGRVTQAGAALRLDQEAIFSVLEDHVDLLQDLFNEAIQERGPRASPDRSL